MSEWFNLQIVPYMDLLIWMKHEKKKVFQNTLGQWLFPEEVNCEINLEERVGKTLNKHIDDICKFEFMEYQKIHNARILRKMVTI